MSSQSDVDVVIESSALGGVDHDLDSSPRPSPDDSEIDPPSVSDVLRVVAGVRSQDVELLDLVGTQSGATTRRLAEVIDRDRSNVNRSLQRLVDAGLVTRRRRIIDSGGYFYEYYAVPEDVLEAVLREAIEEWSSAALDLVDATEWSATFGDDAEDRGQNG